MHKLMKVTKKDNGNVVLQVEEITSPQPFLITIELEAKDVVVLKMGIDRTVRPGGVVG